MTQIKDITITLFFFFYCANQNLYFFVTFILYFQIERTALLSHSSLLRTKLTAIHLSSRLIVKFLFRLPSVKLHHDYSGTFSIWLLDNSVHCTYICQKYYCHNIYVAEYSKLSKFSKISSVQNFLRHFYYQNKYEFIWKMINCYDTFKWPKIFH